MQKNTKDDKEKEKLENDVKNILTDLKKQAINSFDSESDIKRFLDNIVNFNNYSFNNQCLIWLQKPDSKYVASFNTFSKMGYKINESETGIKILFLVFLKFIKVNINDSQFDIKPIYLLSENELKRLKNKKDVFKRMFENYRCIKANLDNLNGYDDFYYEDVETREKHYDDNENYYHINE